MNLKLVPALLIATVGIGLTAFAQQAGQSANPPAAPQRQPPVKKAHKVWTDEDVKELRSPEEINAEAKNTQAEKFTSADRQDAAARQLSPDKPTEEETSPALPAPKSAVEADTMIAAKEQDIASEKEFVDDLQKRLSTAAPASQEKLRRVMEDRMRELATALKELVVLQKQKKELI